jgi:predicted nuclease of restriction endonuclease-like (RecB) superfamily
MGSDITFKDLVVSIRQAHEQLAAQAGKAVNISLTLRNWMIGYYIYEYEQNGIDRAEYGQQLIDKLAEELQDSLDRCYTGRYLRLCRQFYTTYPQIRKSLISKFGLKAIGKLPISKLPSFIKSRASQKVPVTSQQSAVLAEKLVEQLSFTHIAELIKIDDPWKRTFYEIECIRGRWSVRELKRQIASLYYERSGLSKDKKKLAELAQSSIEVAEPKLTIRDPYVFEFLGLKPAEVMSESALEDQLLDKLQEFLLELGHGFCFEARQKRIVIGETYNFVDLVFYHRILKCHVLVELKLSEFSHENIGQLNTYVSWYKRNMMTEGDNPPVGILLCTQKDHALVEYVLAGMDNNIFVSRYQLELPKKEDMERFIQEQMEELGYGL